MAYSRIAVFAHSEEHAVNMMKVYYPQINCFFTGHIKCMHYRASSLPINLSAFITANGELIAIEQLCWFGLGNSIENCTSTFYLLLQSYLHLTKQTPLIVFFASVHT